MVYRNVASTSMLASALMVLAAAACQPAANAISDPKQYRCAADGLCIAPTANGFDEAAGEPNEALQARSLVGGFRQGSDELKFEALYRPPSGDAAQGNPWCYRVQDAMGFRFITTDGPGCPARWHAMAWDLGDNVVPQDEAARFGMLMALRTQLAQAKLPTEQHEARRWVIMAIDSFEEGHQRAAEMDHAPSVDAIPDPTEKTSLRRVKPDQGGLPRQPIGQLLHGDCPQRDPSAVHRAGHMVHFKLPNWVTGVVAPAERVVREHLEFRQEVDLYSKKVQRYMFFGDNTPQDHSASIIRVYARPRGSQNTWVLYDEHTTANHGTHPKADAMRMYESCKQFPTTAGWFAWKGECPGVWGDDHVCNDDTAYQLWHAWGNWSDEPRCIDVFRGERVGCRKPW